MQFFPTTISVSFKQIISFQVHVNYTWNFKNTLCYCVYMKGRMRFLKEKENEPQCFKLMWLYLTFYNRTFNADTFQNTPAPQTLWTSCELYFYTKWIIDCFTWYCLSAVRKWPSQKPTSPKCYSTWYLIFFYLLITTKCNAPCSGIQI